MDESGRRLARHDAGARAARRISVTQ